MDTKSNRSEPVTTTHCSKCTRDLRKCICNRKSKTTIFYMERIKDGKSEVRDLTNDELEYVNKLKGKMLDCCGIGDWMLRKSTIS